MPDGYAEQLRFTVRHLMERRSGPAEVRTAMATGQHDEKTWRTAAVQLGLQGLCVPESSGGSGAGPIELGIVFEELGRCLYVGPFLSTVGLAVTALLAAGDDAASRAVLPGIIAGDTIATLAWGGAEPAESTIVAARGAAGWTLSGTAPSVLDGARADLILVAAQAALPRLFAVTPEAPGLDRLDMTTLDSTRPLAMLTLDETPAEPVGPFDGTRLLTHTFDLATVLLGAEQLGGASQVLETAVEYARTRVQFGRSIGSFQSIKHRLADMLVDLEAARSTVHHALSTASHHPDRLGPEARLARSVASDAYQRIAAASLQIHGGIGFTWEHSAHLYLKRAKSSQLLFGSPWRHRARLARQLGITGPRRIEKIAADEAPTNCSPFANDVDDFLSQHPLPDACDIQADRAFREARFDAGLAVVHFPPGAGGRGADPRHTGDVENLFLHAGAADHVGRNVVGLGMTIPTIAAHGTDVQKERYLRPCFSGEEIWCQLFSEPGAGSDLAAVATRAVRDGDDYVVNGQKIWTFLAHVARFGILLARTDPDVPKHEGLTYFVLDMRSPGVEVRPLRQLTGESEFNEVYLTDVRVPVANVVGAVGRGWQVAMTTLDNERAMIGQSRIDRGQGPIADAVRLHREAEERGETDAATVERLMVLWTRVEAARLTTLRAVADGAEPGPQGSIAKLQMAELNQSVYELCVDLSGADGLLIDGYPDTVAGSSSVRSGSDVRRSYLRALANSIEGGTSEVQRNILGERVLGLPGEPRLDRNVAWKDLRRS